MSWNSIRAQRFIAIALLASVVVAGCSEDTPSKKTAEKSTSKDSSSNTSLKDGAVTLPTPEACKSDLIKCALVSTISDLVPETATEATGTPIKIGHINQETAAAGAFPELTKTAKAGVAFINKELNGVDGHPIELITCDIVNALDAQESLGCAQQMIDAKVVAVLGGVDISGEGITLLSDNGIPFVGGVPVSSAAGSAELSFQLSGGTWGATVAYLKHAADNGAQKVSVVYLDYGVIGESDELVGKTGVALNIDTALFGYGIGQMFDLSPTINAALAENPDAIVVLAADAGCASAYNALETAGTTIPVYMIGACAAPTIALNAGEAATGKMFSIESVLTPGEPDLLFFTGMLDVYDSEVDPVGVSTVEIRSLFALYGALRELGGDAVTSEGIVETFRNSRDVPAFLGHPYTCDGKQFPGVPALCSPQQMLIISESVGTFKAVTDDWIDVRAVLEPSE